MPSTTSSTKLFTHDCTTCVYLGSREGYDIYYHPDKNPLYRTIIARWGNRPEENSSGRETVTSGAVFSPGSAYQEAMRRDVDRLIEQGILHEDQKAAVYGVIRRTGLPTWQSVAAAVIADYATSTLNDVFEHRVLTDLVLAQETSREQRDWALERLGEIQLAVTL